MKKDFWVEVEAWALVGVVFVGTVAAALAIGFSIWLVLVYSCWYLLAMAFPASVAPPTLLQAAAIALLLFVVRKVFASTHKVEVKK